MDETWIEGNGIAFAYPRHRQGFVERKEVKTLLELTTKALLSKKAVSAQLEEVNPRRDDQV